MYWRSDRATVNNACGEASASMEQQSKTTVVPEHLSRETLMEPDLA